MKKCLYITLLSLVFVVLNTSCKSEFEKIRSSGDVDLLYKKAYEYYEAEEYQKAQSLFELIIGSYRGKKELEDIYFKYAYTYYNLNRFILASYYFKNFANTFPNSSMREDADFMSAYSNYQLSPSFRLDQSYSLKAIDEFQLFANTYPESERVEEANRLIDGMRKKLEEKAFDEGRLYYDLRQYQASMHSFETTLKDFPETDRAEEIRYMIIKAGFYLAENSIVTKKEERYKEVTKKAEIFQRLYPTSEYYNEVVTFDKKSQNKLKS